MTKLIFGCGYLGVRVARLWQQAGDAVYVVTRSEQRAAALRKEGWSPIVADITSAESLGKLPPAETVLFAVGFDRSAGKSIEEVYVDGLRNVLDALPDETGHFVYISSTGVYGQNQGEWVDEDSATEPNRDGGRACLAAEKLLASHPRGAERSILRLAGIYGPGRLPHKDDLLAGRPIPNPGDGYLNLIHVEDAARLVAAVADRSPPGEPTSPRVYCISDGCPVLRTEYFEELARQLDVASPKFASPPDRSAPAGGLSSKRVVNGRMAAELGISLAYPSYRAGLSAILSGILAAENP